MFAGRTLVIATKHGKERVIAPILEQALGVQCITPHAFDTDELGTFTGEVERRLDPLETAREKCRRAMDATGCDLAVANEGSFGPHPVMSFVPGDDELMVFLDRRNGLDLVVREVSASTNFAAQEIRDEDALRAFADRARFPRHALILRESPRSTQPIHKGISEPAELRARFREFRARLGHAYVETDMRAMHNPTRMEVIGDAARKLVDLLQSTCPACGLPGFAVTEVIRGLPCEACGLPTNAPSRHISVCGQCGHREEQRNPHGRTRQDPMYCEFCNP